MKTPRSLIVNDESTVHMSWRCHNRSFFLKHRAVKQKILDTYFKYAPKYKINIIDFMIMDNHAHFILYVKGAEHLSNFARCVNSQIASYINKCLSKDSQVIRDRFKSPIVVGYSYLKRLIGYVWFNRYKSDRKSDPTKDAFCSIFHRLNKTKLGEKLASYASLGLCHVQYENQYVKDLFEVSRDYYHEKHPSQIIKDTVIFTDKFTIGDNSLVAERILKIRTFMREKRKKMPFKHKSDDDPPS